MVNIEYDYMNCDVLRNLKLYEFREQYHSNNRRLAESLVMDELVEDYPDIEVSASFIGKFRCCENGLDFQIRTYLVRVSSDNSGYEASYIVRIHINYDIEYVSAYCFGI